jgi:hypothetical protein
MQKKSLGGSAAVPSPLRGGTPAGEGGGREASADGLKVTSVPGYLTGYAT